MPQLIKNNAVIEDNWQLLRELEGGAAVPAGQVIVPLAVWQEQRDALLARGDVGVWLDSDQEPSVIGPDLDALPVIAINFPVFADGRGYSYARLLREKYSYTGELRAIGDVLRDQLLFMKRCGFDAYDLREDLDKEACLAAFDEFSDYYQGGVDNPVPLFLRK